MPTAATILLVLLIAAMPAFAQEDATSRRAAVVDAPLLEPSRVFKNVPDETTGEFYEALLALHFAVGGNMQDSYDAAAQNRRSDWAVLPTITMMVNLRQLQADSAPVRTPSFMPRFRLTAVRSAPPVAKQTTAQWVVDAAFGHYSNGQDGCTFQQQDRSNGCTLSTPVRDEDLIENGVDGSFSSHYLEGAVARRWIRWTDTLLANGRIPSARIVTAFVRVRDYRSVSWIGGGMSDDLQRLYGAVRIRAGGEAVFETDGDGRFRGPHLIDGWIEHAGGRSRAGSWRGAVEYSKTFDGINGTGVFVRGYAGHDDYNIAFLRQIRVLQIGVILGGERRPTFRP